MHLAASRVSAAAELAGKGFGCLGWPTADGGRKEKSVE